MRLRAFSVLLRGVTIEVDLVHPGSVIPDVDIGDAGAGPVVLPVALRGVPAGIEIVRVEPASIELVVRESEPEPVTP